MRNDPITDVVQSLNLAGGVFLEAHFTAPWAISARISEQDCNPFMASPKQVIAYHVVTAGRLVIEIDGAPRREVAQGEVIVLPANDWHVLTSEPGLSPVPGEDLVLPAGKGGLARIESGGGGAETRILCGFLASGADRHPLLDALPRLLTVRLDDLSVVHWLEASMTMAARELAVGRIASAAVVSQLTELLLIETLQRYYETTSNPEGWLAGMRDRQIGRTLALIHRDIAHPWSVEELSAEAAMSRTAFIERFTTLLGMPPIRYLSMQRLNEAKRLLRQSDLATSEIAYRVGYEAPVAFIRAFKRSVGVPPGVWRENADKPQD